jgi:hypothetical protein
MTAMSVDPKNPEKIWRETTRAPVPETGELVLRPFEDDIFSKGGQRLRLFYDILKRTMRTLFIMEINGHSTINLSYSEKKCK